MSVAALRQLLGDVDVSGDVAIPNSFHFSIRCGTGCWGVGLPCHCHIIILVCSVLCARDRQDSPKILNFKCLYSPLCVCSRSPAFTARRLINTIFNYQECHELWELSNVTTQ